MLLQPNVHVEHVFILLILSNILVEPIFVLVLIVIPHDPFKEHMLKIFFQLEVGKMAIDETPTQE